MTSKLSYIIFVRQQKKSKKMGLNFASLKMKQDVGEYDIGCCVVGQSRRVGSVGSELLLHETVS